jgi:hypothetical protein
MGRRARGAAVGAVLVIASTATLSTAATGSTYSSAPQEPPAPAGDATPSQTTAPGGVGTAYTEETDPNSAAVQAAIAAASQRLGAKPTAREVALQFLADNPVGQPPSGKLEINPSQVQPDPLVANPFVTYESAKGHNQDVDIDITGASTKVTQWYTDAYQPSSSPIVCDPTAVYLRNGAAWEYIPDGGCSTFGTDTVWWANVNGPYYFNNGDNLCNVWAANGKLPGEPCERIKG